MTKFKLIFLIPGMFILYACVSAPPETGENTLEIRAGTVKILVTSIRPSYYVPWRMLNHQSHRGSGAIIRDNLIITNAHVVADATLLQVQKENDPETYPASVVHISHECDLALLTVDEAVRQDFFRDTSVLEFNDYVPEMKSSLVTYGFPIGGTRISITEGVVSRIELILYLQSSYISLLSVQTDAAINPGNSGGPVIQDGKIAGIAFQGANAENIGYTIPVPVIRRFLQDVADGSYDGIPSLGIYWSNMENPGFREYLGMQPGMRGIRVNAVLTGSSGVDHLSADDVILSIDGTDVAGDGSIKYLDGRISFSHLITTKQIGEAVELEVWRNNQIIKLKVPLKKLPERIVHHDEYESLPRYFIFGGIIFQPLSREFLKSWNEWWNNADPLFLYYYYFSDMDNLFPQREEFIIINQVLPDTINTYVSNMQYKVVDSINGMTIKRLEDVIEAVKHPLDGYHVILLDGRNKPVILKDGGMEEANRRIFRNYGILSDRRLNVKSGYGVE